MRATAVRASVLLLFAALFTLPGLLTLAVLLGLPVRPALAAQRVVLLEEFVGDD